MTDLEQILPIFLLITLLPAIAKKAINYSGHNHNTLLRISKAVTVCSCECLCIVLVNEGINTIKVI